jgi:protein-S-isoprenylcysteine O-methyltransferase Ste14
MADAPIEERGPDVVAPPPLIYLLPLLAGHVLDRLVPLPRLPRALRRAGPPLLAGGIGLGLWFVASMRRADTPLDPSRPPTALVEDGPFRFTRNPGYLGFALTYAGISLLAGGRWPLVFLPGVLGVIDRGVIAREETYLEMRFGQLYRDYRSRVRRWL